MLSVASTSAPRSALCSCLRRRAAPAALVQARAIHTRPNLPYDIRQGCRPFLSEKAVKGTAIDWHQGNLDRLNDLIRGTRYENQSVAQTVIGSAKSREDALIFGHASEALNNGFFLSCLKPSPSSASPPSPNTPPKDIQEMLSNSFGSLSSFINYFSSYASGQFGSGYVWLVMDAVDNLAVVSTYGAGTVLVQGTEVRAPEIAQFVPVEAEETPSLGSEVAQEGRTASQKVAAEQAASDAIGHELEREPTRPYENSASASLASTRAGPAESAITQSWLSMGGSQSRSMSPPRKDSSRFVSMTPLLALSLHPHVYIPDYGVWGKEKYIQNFWKNVDWTRFRERWYAAKPSARSTDGADGPAAPRFGSQFANRPANSVFAER